MDGLIKPVISHGYNKQIEESSALKFLMTRPAWLKILTYSLNTIVIETHKVSTARGDHTHTPNTFKEVRVMLRKST